MQAAFQEFKDQVDGVTLRTVDFDRAAAEYIANAKLSPASFEAARLALDGWVPRIGAWPLENIHDRTIAGFIEQDKVAGLKSSTVTRRLAVVQTILNLAATKWRHANGTPWLTTPTRLSKPNWDDKDETHVLSLEEQRRLLVELPPHLQRAALFSLHTGIRAGECRALRWEWLRESEAGLYFLLPGSITKNREGRAIPLNTVASSIIQSLNAECEFVFTYRGEGIKAQLNTKAFRNARKRAGIPMCKWHSFRHTCATRLMMAGVDLETRNLILGHERRSVGAIYARGTLEQLFAAVELLTQEQKATILRRKLLSSV